MAEKANPAKTLAAQREGSRGRAQTDATRSVQPAFESLFGLQRDLGNQAVVSLFESGLLQAKLRVSQPGDADEQEADRIADQIVSRQRTPTLHRKCACEGGASCAKCAGDQEDEVIHRSVAPLHSFPVSLQRAAADTAPEQHEAGSPASRHLHRPHSLLVDDEARSLEPGQMRKTEFLEQLRAAACATADAVLAAVGHSTKACPYVAKWLSFYSHSSAEHVERALLKYAPEARRARSAHEYMSIVNRHVQRATLEWAKTGNVTGLPDEIQQQLAGAGGGFLARLTKFASTGVTGAVLGFFAGKKSEQDAGIRGPQRKAQDGAATAANVADVRGQLGTGRALDSRVQSQMSSAFRHDFSTVRIHTEAEGAKLSAQLKARAFTIGNDVAFAAGEYKPGTLIGDALIAHELAHVVQQGGAAASSAPMKKTDGESSSLEADADDAAAAAVLSFWTGRQNPKLARLTKAASTRLRSGLRLQRCDEASDKTPVTTTTPTGSGSATPPPPPPAHASADGSKVTTPFGEFEAVKYHALVQKSTDKEVGVEMFLRFNPGPKVEAKQIGLTQAASGKVGGTPATADPNYGRRSATSAPGKGEFVDVLTGFPSPLYASASTPTAGADPSKLTSYPTVPSRALTAPEITSHEASTGITGETRTGFGKNGFRYMEAGKLKGPEPAELYDSPTLGAANDSEQIFESTALAIEGTQKDTYYGSVNWGWKRDSSGTFSMIPFKVISQGTPSAGFLTAASIFSTVTEDFNWGVSAATANIVDAADLTKTTAAVARGTALDWGGTHVALGGVEYRLVSVKDGPSKGSAGLIRPADMAMMDVGRPTVHLPVPDVYTTNAASSPLVGNPAKEGSTLIKNLPKDTRVTITDATTNPHWSKIMIVDGPDTNTEGWVKKTLLTREALGKHI